MKNQDKFVRGNLQPLHIYNYMYNIILYLCHKLNISMDINHKFCKMYHILYTFMQYFIYNIPLGILRYKFLLNYLNLNLIFLKLNLNKKFLNILCIMQTKVQYKKHKLDGKYHINLILHFPNGTFLYILLNINHILKRILYCKSHNLMTHLQYMYYKTYNKVFYKN